MIFSAPSKAQSVAFCVSLSRALNLYLSGSNLKATLSDPSHPTFSSLICNFLAFFFKISLSGLAYYVCRTVQPKIICLF